MDIDSFLRDPLSRRRFFHMSGAGVGAGGAATLLAACGDESSSLVTGPDESDQADVEILNGALDLELQSVEAYKLAAGRMRGSVLEIGKRFLAQEQEHADGLATVIEDAGGKPNRAKASYDFPQMRTQEDAVRFVLALENDAIASYIDALPKFSQGELRAMAASILTNEAEHVAVLLDAIGMDPLSGPLVTGSVS